MKKRETNYKKGIWAEYLAALFFILKGYKILALRFKTKGGEIDLIVKRGKIIAAVEVKFRKKMESAAEAISENSRLRIQRAFQYFIMHNASSGRGVVKAGKGKEEYDYRFDAVLIVPFKIQHIENAWG